MDSGLKATHQRIVIFEALQQLHGQHPAAEDVFNRLKPENPSISLGTVYKALDNFVEAGLVRRVLSEEGSRRYDANCEAHSHLYCSDTNEIIDYHDPELHRLIGQYLQQKHFGNFNIETFSVQLTGFKTDPGKHITIETHHS